MPANTTTTINRRQFIDCTSKTIIGTGACACHCLFAAPAGAANLTSGAKTVAACGIYCGACPAFLKSMKAKRSSEVGCLGCLSSKVGKFASKCEIRSCAKSKGVESCGVCESYPCEKITDFMEAAPDKAKYGLRKKYLDGIAEEGLPRWQEDAKKRWCCTECGEPFGYADQSCPECDTAVYSAEKEYADYLKK